MYGKMVMNEKVISVYKFTGIIFMTITSLMFYNHLYTAAGNPGFFVTVYFNYFGEGTMELIIFTLFLPFIVLAFLIEAKEVIENGKHKN